MEVRYHHFPSGKRYAYIHTDTGPIFLRNMILLTKGTDRHTIAIVHEWGKSTNRWEPPKGQMEWKEFGTEEPVLRLTQHQLQEHMRKAILREMTEEAYILPKEIQHFRILPVTYVQEWSKSGIRNARFLYQYWTAQITDKTLLEAQKRIQTIVDNPDWKEILPKDLTEKDAIHWWNPTHDGFHAIRGGFSQTMTRQYYDFLATEKNETVF